MHINLRNIERVARELKRSRCEVAYIRHYLMDEYQCDAESIDKVLEKIGMLSDDPMGGGGGGNKSKPKGFQRF